MERPNTLCQPLVRRLIAASSWTRLQTPSRERLALAAAQPVLQLEGSSGCRSQPHLSAAQLPLANPRHRHRAPKAACKEGRRWTRAQEGEGSSSGQGRDGQLWLRTRGPTQYSTSAAQHAHLGGCRCISSIRLVHLLLHPLQHTQEHSERGRVGTACRGRPGRSCGPDRLPCPCHIANNARWSIWPGPVLPEPGRHCGPRTPASWRPPP